MAKFRQLLLLTWKNFKLQSRHPWITLLELGVPAFFFALCLVLVRSAISSDFVSDPVIYQPFSIDELPRNLTPGDKQFEIIYAPSSTFLDEIMNDTAFKLSVAYQGFSNESTMIEYIDNTKNEILSGVVFDEILMQGLNNSTKIEYTIRPKQAEGGNSAFKDTTKKNGKLNIPFLYYLHWGQEIEILHGEEVLVICLRDF
ncbi:ATP-binding cassette sub-family A member 3 [Caerostris extrusa]|uniref:ATP-binding cassette sub-family A member 3 n=1 Tax=Caerostris extrusa TaxID=172846 RepID=A0AAV4VFU1_CAEEX|nr:ATP-binding cassette sub-family A member 3 [Caerostris extrusa]